MSRDGGNRWKEGKNPQLLFFLPYISLNTKEQHTPPPRTIRVLSLANPDSLKSAEERRLHLIRHSFTVSGYVNSTTLRKGGGGMHNGSLCPSPVARFFKWGLGLDRDWIGTGSGLDRDRIGTGSFETLNHRCIQHLYDLNPDPVPIQSQSPFKEPATVCVGGGREEETRSWPGARFRRRNGGRKIRGRFYACLCMYYVCTV